MGNSKLEGIKVAVVIEVVGSQDTSEYKAALILEEYLMKGIPATATGKISIVSNVQLTKQSVSDIDILVFGYLENYLYSDIGEDSQTSYGSVENNTHDFCIVIELKEHDPKNIKFRGTSVLVKYSEGWSDATNQSTKQKYAINNYLTSRGFDKGYWIYNLIWIKNLSVNEVTHDVVDRITNLLFTEVSFEEFFRLLLIQQSQKKNYRSNRLTSIPFYEKSTPSQKYEKLMKIFAGTIEIGGISRRIIERLINAEVIKLGDIESSIGKDLIIFSGRAGTGKTSKLLSIGCQMAQKNKFRCLYLTFNQICADDANRLLCLAKIPSIVTDQGSIETNTIGAFVKELAIAAKILSDDSSYHYEMHKDLCIKLKMLFQAELITEERIAERLHGTSILGFDYILVDEAEDFIDEEKDLLFILFGYNKLIVSDGVDQLIRKNSHSDWRKRVFCKKFQSNTSFRQKSELVRFINSYAISKKEVWGVLPSTFLSGGRIIISKKLKPFELFEEERKRCVNCGNTNFDMIFLTPPSFVSTSGQDKGFIFRNEFSEQGIPLWDGTVNDGYSGYGDSEYPRLVQYDDCRGIEGWTVVCLGFDRMLEWKSYKFAKSPEHYSETEILRLRTLWSIIPLSRAIDTIIITFENPELIEKIFPPPLTVGDNIEIVD